MAKMTKEEKAARKVEREKQRYVDKLKSILKRDYKEMVRRGSDDLPLKRRQFKVGDQVSVGALEWSAILEICENHLFYKVLSVTPIVRYGKREGTEFRIWYVHWTDCVPYYDPEEESRESLIKNKDLRLSYSQREIRSLVGWYYHGFGIDMEPDYQRDHVWTKAQKVKLIDSVFNHSDIGKFTFIRRGFDISRKCYYEILDGKQRLKALCEFFTDSFKYKGKYFSELSYRDQSFFESYPISYAEAEPMSDEQKYRFFLMLNDTGTPMSKKHLNKVQSMLDEVKS